MGAADFGNQALGREARRFFHGGPDDCAKRRHMVMDAEDIHKIVRLYATNSGHDIADSKIDGMQHIPEKLVFHCRENRKSLSTNHSRRVHSSASPISAV